MSNPTRRFAALLAAIVMAACDKAGVPALTTPAFSTRDSAGITVFESARPAWDAQTQWSIDSLHRVTIGLEDGDPQYLFENIVGGAVLSDGRIAVMDGGSSELRFYSGDGRYLAKIGRKGDGPGEFQRAENVVRLGGDTIVIYDTGFGGISTLVGDHFIHHTRGNPDGVMGVIGLHNATEHITPLADGSVVIHATHRDDPALEAWQPGVVNRRSTGYYRISSDRSSVDSLGWYEHGLPNLFLNFGGRRHYDVPPFAAQARLAGSNHGRRLYVTAGDQYEIMQFADGKRALIRRLNGLVEIPPDVKARAMKQARARPVSRWETRGQIESLIDAMPDPKYYPAINGLIVDSEDYLWVSTARGYDVFNPQGTWLGTLPVLGKAIDIGKNYVMSMTRDSMQIERVHVARLDRRGH